MSEDDDTREFRIEILKSCGATSATLEELLAYTDNPFKAACTSVSSSFPLADEPHLGAWRDYATNASEIGAFGALKKRFAQLQFPIRAGMSQEESYRAATRRGLQGMADDDSPGLVMNCPSELDLLICPTMAGAIPVLIAADREDFVALIRAFTKRNEPERVPASMGACIVSGLNNWDRIATYRRAWEREHDSRATEDAWSEEFRRLVPRKELYQDRFVILSRGPYSAVAAGDAGLDERDWLARSLTIRREHEFTHYFTYRVFGAMRNNLLDELIADYVGLVRAYGEYRAELALKFLGIESFPRYREEGRLQSYRGEPPLSDEAMQALRCVAFRSIENLAGFSSGYGGGAQDLSQLARLTFALATLTLEEMASSEMSSRVRSCQRLN